ncbi:hydantoinase/oxoprolinase family protein [Sphingobium sufflavum]|uniref:hydantoinase/oxoprolinase family protein n=1 Tax=Sphingobium sufflavum TaxID=1129547 RepID=UPI001F491854|nr:hydantoinase/oxoprolinase family protein [Sphingobium sufflavum]MCE7796662.1 hydantoinase/oxoprolinase family protein [Sphingobium sufflavum]
MGYRVGIDIGGTFTDFALLKDREVTLFKNLSTPEDRSIGVMNGLSKLAEMENLPLADFLGACDAVVHGTTIADNTLIEMNGAVTGLITTEGFRDEMEYRRGYKEDIWDLRLAPPVQITPRRRRLTVPERILHDGTVHQPLDEAAVRAQCRRLAKQGVESVAISFLFSFVNPQHEQRVAQIVAQELPGVQVSKSHEVLPRAPEYDRTSTTVVNAYVAPRVTHYLENLVRRVRDAGYAKQLMVMQASGGVMTRDYIQGAPIRVLASGPAGGVIGSAHVGTAKGHRNILCVDMGGTSYDISMVLDGAAPAVAGWNMHHRYLVGVPMVQVETLGAGGGSICHVHKGEIAVGPASAGASPGPICYGRGGSQPTITDALLMLGILSDEAVFAGGSFSLTRRGVEDAFAAIGADMGYGAEDAAFDCWRIVNANMTLGVRRITAGKGIAPQDMVMLAYGGNGPAFACTQADELGIETVLVPRASPTFSALGTLVADPRIDEERSHIAAADTLDIARVRTLWADLAARAKGYFTQAGFPADSVTARYQMNMRYPGQNWSLSFDARVTQGLDDLSFVDETLRDLAIRSFNERHMAEYGHVREDEMPEVTGIRLTTSVETPSPMVVAGFTAPPVAAAPARQRRANLGRGYEPVGIFAGPDLKPGHHVTGPAIIEESFTTIAVYPGWQARLDDAGDYRLVKLDALGVMGFP